MSRNFRSKRVRRRIYAIIANAATDPVSPLPPMTDSAICKKLRDKMEAGCPEE